MGRNGKRRRVYPSCLQRAADGSAFTECTHCGRSVPIALSGFHELECPSVRERKLQCPQEKPPSVHGGAREKPRYAAITSNDTCDRVHRDRETKQNCPVIIGNDGGVPGREKGGIFHPLRVLRPLTLSTSTLRTHGLEMSLQPRSAFVFFMERYKKESELQDWFEIDRTGLEYWKSMSREERDPFIDISNRVCSVYDKLLLWWENTRPQVLNSHDVPDACSTLLGNKAVQGLELHTRNGAYEISKEHTLPYF